MMPEGYPQTAMILAAGRGERMRPLTDRTPKPLLKVAGKPLIEYHIEALARLGIRRLVINVSHLGEQIMAAVGDGGRWGVEIRYSMEPEGALETGGGIQHALGLLGEAPFLALNGDIWIDQDLPRVKLSAGMLAHLLLIDNPPHHPQGDFCLQQGMVTECRQGRLTFSGIGIYRAALFDGIDPGRFPLAPLLRAAMADGAVSGERLVGSWIDVGTPQRLQQLDRQLRGLSTG